jgi:hypothetical protein
VVGRIQLRYDAGFWNEWYILFDDGSAGWLSDASGQYASPSTRPGRRRAALRPDRARRAVCPDGVTYSAPTCAPPAARRRGRAALPVGAGWEAKVADYRQTHRFLTLDYSDGARRAATSARR